jgi:hypothetical protein
MGLWLPDRFRRRAPPCTPRASKSRPTARARSRGIRHPGPAALHLHDLPGPAVQG